MLGFAESSNAPNGTICSTIFGAFSSNAVGVSPAMMLLSLSVRKVLARSATASDSRNALRNSETSSWYLPRELREKNFESFLNVTMWGAAQLFLIRITIAYRRFVGRDTECVSTILNNRGAMPVW